MLEGRVTRQLVVSLLNHIRAFSDWAQCFVLELVTHYRPASEEERFDILEVRPRPVCGSPGLCELAGRKQGFQGWPGWLLGEHTCSAL